MGPLRIIILVALIYIGYRLITKSFKKDGNKKKVDTESAKSSQKFTDVLVEDPVCHKLVPKQQAVSLENDEETHYFCSQECCKKFTSEQGDDI